MMVFNEKKTLFLRTTEKRNESHRKRDLYVMNDVYHGNSITTTLEHWLMWVFCFADCMTSISEYLPNYQQSLKTLQNEDFEAYVWYQ